MFMPYILVHLRSLDWIDGLLLNGDGRELRYSEVWKIKSLKQNDIPNGLRMYVFPVKVP